MTSLKTLLALKPSVLYPAHRPHIPTREAAAEHITNYINHRQQREDEIVKILQDLAFDPTRLGLAIADVMDKWKEDKAKEEKYTYEFLSGKPRGTSKPAKKAPGWGRPAEDVAQEAEVDEEEVKAQQAKEEREKIVAKFPQGNGATIPLICRLIYKTPDDKVIFAASKSVEAHMAKLESEGKVRKVSLTLPTVVDGVVNEPAHTEGWEWAAELSPEEMEKRKVKVEKEKE